MTAPEIIATSRAYGLFSVSVEPYRTTGRTLSVHDAEYEIDGFYNDPELDMLGQVIIFATGVKVRRDGQPGGQALTRIVVPVPADVRDAIERMRAEAGIQ